MYRRVELVRHNEIRGLVKAGDALCPLRFPVADAGLAEHVLNSAFDHVPDQFANRVAVPGERPAEEALIQQHRIGHAQVCDRPDAGQAIDRIDLVEPVQDQRAATPAPHPDRPGLKA
jgi:hypothetical protein